MAEETKPQEVEVDVTLIPKTEYEKAVQRAQRFEGQLVDLQKRLEQYKDIDPTEYKVTKERLFELEKKSAGSPEDIERLVEARAKDLTKPYETKLKEYESKCESASSRLKTLEVVNVGLDAAHKRGFLPEAMGDVERYIRDNCDLYEGQVVKDKDGKPLASQKTPGTYMSAEEFLEGLKQKKPFMVKSEFVAANKQAGEKKGTGAVTLPPDFASWDIEKKRELFRKDQAYFHEARRQGL